MSNTRTKVCSQCETLRRIEAQTCEPCTAKNAHARITDEVFQSAATAARAALVEALEAMTNLDTQGRHTPLIDRIETLLGEWA